MEDFYLPLDFETSPPPLCRRCFCRDDAAERVPCIQPEFAQPAKMKFEFLNIIENVFT